VLKFPRLSSVECSEHDGHLHNYCYSSFTVEHGGVQMPDGSWSGGVVQQQVRRFATCAEAVEARELEAEKRGCSDGHSYFVWECSITDFLRCQPSTQQAAQMYQPAGLAPPFVQCGQSLQSRLREALHVAKSAAAEDAYDVDVDDPRLSEDNVALTG